MSWNSPIASVDSSFELLKRVNALITMPTNVRIQPNGLAFIVAHKVFTARVHLFVTAVSAVVTVPCTVFAAASAAEAVRDWFIAAVSSVFFFA